MSEEDNIKKYGNSEVVIQLYAKVTDLIRTEYLTTENAINDYEKTLLDVEKNGFKDSLKIKPDGLVMRGNTRCDIAEELDIEYLPIDAGFFVGIHTTDEDHVMTMRKIFYDEEFDNVNNKCRPVKKPTTEEYRKKIGFDPYTMIHEDYLINWSDEFMFLESHFEAVGVPHDINVKKELFHLEELINHWKECEKIPTKEENCKWCYLLFDMSLNFKEVNKDE